MEIRKKHGLYLMLAGATVLVGALAFVLAHSTTMPGEVPTATTTKPVATTTNPFSLPPIVPEAKVSTEGWKTCRNEEYGYEFKFPPEWHIYGEDALSNTPKPSFVRESQSCNGVSVFFSTTQLSGYPTNMDAQMWIYVYSPGTVFPFPDLWTYASQKSNKAKQYYLFLNNHGALLQLYDTAGEVDWYVTSWVGENVYTLHGPRYADRQAVVQTLLSTLRFLDDK